MKPLRVSWSDGMFLGPQHFQLWDRYHQGVLDARVRTLHPFEWGIVSAVVDEEALTRNAFALTRLEVVFKDGLYVSAPDLHPLPAARPLPVGGKLDSLDVSVAVPAPRDGVPVVRRVDREVDARFVETMVNVDDESEPGNAEQVPVAHPNVRFVFDGDPLEGLEVMPVARLSRTLAGGFSVDADFVPPVLTVGAAPRFVRLLNQTYARMVDRIEALTAAQAARAGQASLSQEDQLAFWYLAALNSALPRLAHLMALPRAHPADAFAELVALAGALTAFVPDLRAKDLPTYAHEDLTARLGRLEAVLNRVLATLFNRRCVAMPLEHVRRFLWKTDVPEGALEQSRFILYVRSSQIDANPDWFTVHAKVGASDQIDRLIARRLAGVRIEHLARPPESVPVRPDGSYFQVRQEGDEWAAVKKCGSLSVFVPRVGDDKLSVELLAVQA